MIRHLFNRTHFHMWVLTMFIVTATMTDASGAASYATLPQGVEVHKQHTSAAWSERDKSLTHASCKDVQATDDFVGSMLPQDSDIAPATPQDKDFECMSVCRNICWLIWQSATAYCEKSIPPKKRKERERCFRRANEEYAACIKDCERENGRCN